MFHGMSKHMEMKYHFIRDMVQKGMVKIEYINTQEPIVDVMTKPISVKKFKHIQNKIGMVENASLVETEC